jgi:hypothetical protein
MQTRMQVQIVVSAHRENTSVPPLGSWAGGPVRFEYLDSLHCRNRGGQELVDCVCSCSEFALPRVPGGHLFVPSPTIETRHGPMVHVWYVERQGCLMQARQGAAGLTAALYYV